MINKEIFIEYRKFFFIGIIRTIITFSVYVLLLNFFHPLISLTIVWIFAIPITSYLHQNFVFQKKNDNKILLKYFTIYISIYLLNSLVLYISVDVLLLDPAVSQFVILIGLSLINFFFIRKIYKL